MDITAHFNANFFALFDLPVAFVIDVAELDRRYREVQAQVHPDRFTQADNTQRRLSMQWATRANEAYQTLKKPLARAKYVLELAGVDLQAESNTAMAPEFLMEQMEWREAVMEARMGGEHHELEHLHNRLRADIRQRYTQMGDLLDTQQDYAAAAELARRLMFLEKLVHEIDDALTALDE